ncbi:MAG TPA: ferritin-like domain-containing protein [Solirubrobacterales bacterium]|nr:ferritin-like domain-containing protein [Solirubrobacterales bacterium]
MGSDSSAGGFGRRRGFGRAAAALVLGLAASLVAAGGCGNSGYGAETDPEKGSDTAILNGALARELTLLDAYALGRNRLRGPQRAVGQQLRAQEQEYADALTKGIRGLGGDTEAEPEELDLSQAKGQAGFLALLYELESAALASYIDAAARLYTSAPRTLDASLAVGHAQHLVLLRQGLGASAVVSAPEAFDGGEVPPPSVGSPGGGG